MASACGMPDSSRVDGLGVVGKVGLALKASSCTVGNVDLDCAAKTPGW